MTKERLEEIRKRKYAEDRIVYTVFDNDEEATALHIVHDNELLVAYIMLKRVYETKEQAEWHAKTYAERTERFEPPMWEEINGHYEFAFVVQIEQIRFVVRKESTTFCPNGSIYAFGSSGKHYVDEPATKENYEKACEIVRDLFKEEK